MFLDAILGTRPIVPRCEPSATTAVIFVHGFWSDSTTWNPIVKLLNKDDEFCKANCFACFEYSTPRILWKPATRIPTLVELGASLEAFLGAYVSYENWVLVGHSQGGLVIQSYLKRKIEKNEGNDLARIRSVIMLATPNQGSNTFPILRRILFSILHNPQEEGLQTLNPDVADLHRFIQDRILKASQVSAGFCPIPFVAFYGYQDAVVPRASAMGAIAETVGLRADHFTIIKPDNDKDERYTLLRKAILHPAGHPSVFEIDECSIELKVSPQCEPYKARYGAKERIVDTDNKAERTLKVVFSAANRCYKSFPVRYRTDNLKGFVRDPSGELKLDIADRGAYDIAGTDLKYYLKPQGSDRPQEFHNVVEVYGGFDVGNRNWHFHLNLNLNDELGVHYKVFRFSLDLTGYSAGYEITAPNLYFHRADVPCGILCEKRGKGAVQKGSSAAGVWSWELRECRSGVIDVDWDVAKKRETSVGTSYQTSS